MTGDDLAARLRAAATETWEDPIGGGLVRHGFVLPDRTRQLLLDAADRLDAWGEVLDAWDQRESSEWTGDVIEALRRVMSWVRDET